MRWLNPVPFGWRLRLILLDEMNDIHKDTYRSASSYLRHTAFCVMNV